MKLSVFLEEIKKNQEEVVYYCCNHVLSKKYNINEDSVDNDVLKDLFVNYDNFTKSLNDSLRDLIPGGTALKLKHLHERLAGVFFISRRRESVPSWY